MSATLEFITHLSVLLFYIVAFAMAAYAHKYTRLWARKVSTASILIAALAWIVFYTVITDPLNFPQEVHSTVLWSRVMHYVTSSALFTMAFLIYRADKYGIDYEDPTGED